MLYTGKDFVIVDFEGDPGRPLSERRIKRSPLEDVAGMIESLYTASHGVLWGEAPGVITSPELLPALGAWARFWGRSASLALLDSYLETPGIVALMPQAPEQVRMLLRLFVMNLALRKLNLRADPRAGAHPRALPPAARSAGGGVNQGARRHLPRAAQPGLPLSWTPATWCPT